MRPRKVRMSRETRWGWRRVIMGAALVAVLGETAPGFGTAVAVPQPPAVAPCPAPGSQTLASSKLVRVYRLNRRLYGCLIGSGRTRRLDGSSRVVIGGTWVARTTSVVDRTGGRTTWIVASDLRTDRRKRVEYGYNSGAPAALAVSARGTLAWLSRDTSPSYGTGSTFAVAPSAKGRPFGLATDSVAGISVLRARADGTFSKPERVRMKLAGFPKVRLARSQR